MAISGGDGSITLTTKIDESGLKSGMSKLKSGIGAVGKAFTAVGVTAAAGFAVVTKAAVDSYAEFEQLSGGVQKIFNEIDYSKIAEDAGNAYKTMGMSANEYLGVMTTVGANFASTLGDAKGYEVAKQGMQAISDFASGTGRSVDELSEKYQMITKSTSSYQSIADQFAGILPATSAEFLKQAQAAGFLSENYTKLTDVPMAEYQEAVTQMLSKGVDALGLTGNTAMEAATTLSGSTAMMKASWQNLLTGMADPTQNFDVLLQNFISSIGAFAGNLLPVIQTAAQGVLQMVQGLLPQLASMITQMLPMVVDGVVGIVDGIVQVAPQIVEAIVGLLPQLLTATTNLITQIATALPALMQVIVSALPAMIQSIVAALPTMIPALINGIVQAIVILVGALPQIIQPIIDNLPMIITAISGALISNLPLLIQAAIQLVLGIVAAIPQIISGLLQAMGEIAVQIGQALFNALPEPVKNAFQSAFDAIKAVWDLVQPYFEMVWESIKAVFSVVGEILGGFFEVAWAAIQAVWNAVTGYFEAIWNTIAGIFSVVASVLSGNWSDAWAAIKGIVGTWSSYFASVWASIKNVFAAVQSWFSNTFSAAVAAIKSVFSSITSYFSTIWQSVKNVFSDAKSKFLSIGSDIVAGIKSGISNAWSNLVSWFGGLFGDLKSIAKRILGIASPSKWFRDYIGKMIPAGMAIGIERASGLVTKAITILMEDTRSEAQKVIDGSNEVLLESERLYYAKKEEMEKNKKQKEFEKKLANAKTEEERQKIHNEKMIELQEEADNAYLQQLKDTAETERKLYEARLKDIENLKKQVVDTYNDMANDALKSIEDLQKSQDSFAEKLFNYGDILTEKEGLGWEKIPYNVLSNQEEQIEFLEKYNDALTAVKSRGNIPQDFFSMLRDMSLEEGLEVATLLLEASDDDFAKFIDDWKRKQQVAKQISKNLYKDEANELSKEVSGKFDEVANSFFGIGNDAANNFEDGFLEQLKITVSSIRYIISSALLGVGGYLGSYANIEGAVNFPTKIPAMATGGIVPHKTLALIGENGKEAVLPLENNTSWMDVLTNKIATKVGGASSTVILEIDGREFGRAVVEQGNRESRRVGTKLVIA